MSFNGIGLNELAQAAVAAGVLIAALRTVWKTAQPRLENVYARTHRGILNRLDIVEEDVSELQQKVNAE